MKQIFLTIPVCVIIVLTACTNSSLNKGQQGALGGSAGGALVGQAIGGDTEATLIGAAVGGLLGYIVGNEMDKYDRRQLNQAYENVPSGQTTSWQNPDSGNSYTVTPKPAYTPADNPQQPCRQAEIVARIDGETERTFTTACRNANGQWVLQQ